MIQRIMQMDWSNKKKAEVLGKCVNLYEERVREAENSLNHCREMIYQLEEKGD